MPSNQLNPYTAPTTNQFIDLFQKDIIHFLSSKIVKDYRVDLTELSHDFIAHFYCEEMLTKYSPDYNRIRVLKLQRQLEEKKEEFRILETRNHQTMKDKRALEKIKKDIIKKEEKLDQYKKTVGRMVKFKTYLFWCLRSYWWWHVVKTVSVYQDEDGVIREHIRTTPPPILLSQMASKEDNSDPADSVFQSIEEEKFKAESNRSAAKSYLEAFESYLRQSSKKTLAQALSMLVAGMDLEDVSKFLQKSTEELLEDLQSEGYLFSSRISKFSEFFEYYGVPC